MTEQWKDIQEFKGLYQASSYGRIKSLSRSNTFKEKILKPTYASKSYQLVKLRKDGKTHSIYVHQLVAMAFLGHKPDGHNKVINHKDGNTRNNYLWNLEIVTTRENLSRFRSDKDSLSSLYVGVHFHKIRKKWESSIMIDGVKKYLGRFDSELKAANAYLLALN